MNKYILFFKRIARAIILKINFILDFILLINKVPYEKDKIAFLEYAGIGDFLLNSIFIDRYINHFSTKKISLIVSDLVYPIAYTLFDKYPNVKIYGITIKKFEYNFLYRNKLLKKLGQQEKVYAIHPTFDYNNFFIYQKIISKKYIRYQGEPYYYKLRVTDIKNEYIIKNIFSTLNVNIVLHLNSISNYIVNTNIKLELLRERYDNIFNNFTYQNISFNLPKDYIVIITDSSSIQRNLSIQQWQTLLDKIPSHINIVQLGINELKLIHSKLYNLLKKTSLLESISIIKNAKVVIGNETGLSHFSYLIKKPTIIILGGGHYGRFLPSPIDFDVELVMNNMDCFECGWHCTKTTSPNEIFPCIKNISPDIIFKILKKKGVL